MKVRRRGRRQEEVNASVHEFGFELPVAVTSPLPPQPVWRQLNVSFLLQARAPRGAASLLLRPAIKCPLGAAPDRG